MSHVATAVNTIFCFKVTKGIGTAVSSSHSAYTHVSHCSVYLHLFLTSFSGNLWCKWKITEKNASHVEYYAVFSVQHACDNTTITGW